MEREVWILFIKNQCCCDEDQECIVAFETEELLNMWLDDYCQNNNLNKSDLDYATMLNGIFNNVSWRKV